MAADMEFLYDRIEKVLQDCRSYFSSSDYELTDSTLFSLQCCSSVLSGYISNILYGNPLSASSLSETNESPSSCSSGSELSQLRDLHKCIDQLLITWQTKLLRIESGTTAQTGRGGRPPRTINIELVRLFVV